MRRYAKSPNPDRAEQITRRPINPRHRWFVLHWGAGQVPQLMSSHRWHWAALVWAGVLQARHELPGWAFVVVAAAKRARWGIESV